MVGKQGIDLRFNANISGHFSNLFVPKDVVMLPLYANANVFAIFQLCLFSRSLILLVSKHGKTRPVSFYASGDLELCQTPALFRI